MAGVPHAQAHQITRIADLLGIADALDGPASILGHLRADATGIGVVRKLTTTAKGSGLLNIAQPGFPLLRIEDAGPGIEAAIPLQFDRDRVTPVAQALLLAKASDPEV